VARLFKAVRRSGRSLRLQEPGGASEAFSASGKNNGVELDAEIKAPGRTTATR